MKHLLECQKRLKLLAKQLTFYARSIVAPLLKKDQNKLRMSFLKFAKIKQNSKFLNLIYFLKTNYNLVWEMPYICEYMPT